MTENTINKFDSKDYKRSRIAYIAQCTFEYFVTILVADAFLAKLLTNIGISDSMIGIISSLISFAFLFQLLSIFVARKITNVKKTAIIFHTLHQLFFLSLYLIPFIPASIEVKTTVVFVSIMLAYISNYMVSSIIFKWANSYVDPKNRGKFSACKEMISLITGIAFTLIVGQIVDRYEAVGNIEGSFIFISITMIVLTISNFISFLLIKNEKQDLGAMQHVPFREVIKNTLGNRSFVNVIILTVLWDIARYMTLGFLGTFKTNDLLLSVGTVQIINMIANIGRMAVSIPFGKYSDKHSYAGGMKLAYIIIAFGFLTLTFTTPKRWWLIIVYTVLFNVSLAGSNQNSSNIAYSYVKSEYIVPAMAIKNSIGGIFGFLSSLAGSRILAYVQANGNTFLGIPMYGQQLLAAISFVVVIIAILFIHFVIEKQKVMLQ